MRVDFRAVAAIALGVLNSNCGSSDSGGGHAGAGGGNNTAAGNSNGDAGSGGGDSAGAAGSGGGDSAGTAGSGGGDSAGAAGSGGGDSAGAAGSGTIVGGNPDGTWTNVTSNLAGISTMCGNTGMIYAKPDKDELIAGVALQGLWSSVDAGKSWQQLAGSTKITASTSALIFDPKDSGRYWVVGNHAAPYLFATVDDGASFTAPGDGAYQGLDYLSLDFSDPSRNLLLIGFHESAQSVSLSTDGGANWKPVGAKLPGGVYCSTPFVVDAKTFLVGCADGQLQRSTDSGGTWSKVSGKGSNRAPLQASDGSLYWPCTDGSLIRSTNGGANWSDVLGTGSVGTPFPPVELPDGRVTLIAKDGIIAGKPDGGTWTHVAPTLPSDPYTFTYSKQEKAFYYGHGDCLTVVPSDAIMRFAYDYTKG
jgi:hypothetical protein